MESILGLLQLVIITCTFHSMMESSSINPAAEIHAITATSTPVRYHSNDSLEHILVTTLDGNMVNDG